MLEAPRTSHGRSDRNSRQDPVEVVIRSQFTNTPGSRYRKDGPFSGEEFYETLLRSAFQKAAQMDVPLIVDLDGTYGYATSFLNEAFVRLSTEFGRDTVKKRLQIVSREDLNLLDMILQYIDEANQK